MRRVLVTTRAAREHRVEQLLLVDEVVVEQRVVRADALGHVLERHAVQAVLGEQVLGRVEDLLHLLGALLHLGRAPARFRFVRHCSISHPPPYSDPQPDLVDLTRWRQVHARHADDLVGNPPRRHLAAQRREQRLVADRLAARASATTRIGRSPHLRCGRPITAASETSGCALTTASISAGLIHSPPDLIRSLARPVMMRLPSASMRARSPVGNQPSASVARCSSPK